MKIVKTRKVRTPERVGKNAGIDFFVPSDFSPMLLISGGRVNIPSGIHVKMPDGYCLIAFNKSGITSKYGLQVGACVVDENYTGEIHLSLINNTLQNVAINPDQKIVQFLVLKPNYVNIEVFEKLNDIYKLTDHLERGSQGFGSTGE